MFFFLRILGRGQSGDPVVPMAKNAYCSRDIYLQLERSVITPVIIHSAQKKLIHWLL